MLSLLRLLALSHEFMCVALYDGGVRTSLTISCARCGGSSGVVTIDICLAAAHIHSSTLSANRTN